MNGVFALFDPIDSIIRDLRQHDASLSASEVANRVVLTPPTARRCITRLRDCLREILHCRTMPLV